MNLNEYDRVSQLLLTEAAEIEKTKRPAYTTGSADVLANFKRIAERTGLTPGQVLTVYMLKHIDSVTAALTQPNIPQAEALSSRFADAINYLKLGWALVTEVENFAKLQEESQSKPTAAQWNAQRFLTMQAEAGLTTLPPKPSSKGL